MKTFFISLLILFFALPCFAQLSGRVVSIFDGDTFTLLTSDKKQIKIRLHGVDCPEKGQPFGQKAKGFVSKRIFSKMVAVSPKKKDRYGRTLGLVFIEGECLNEALLKNGFAWHYMRYDKNKLWSELEAEARRKKIGLWADKHAQPPWEFRKAKKADR
ncbi:MAG TPA: thermonuclease family protein [Flavipsychrobacter sp.]|nr:thermonuclease family protein [Flavipsychrobacter sp.]